MVVKTVKEVVCIGKHVFDHLVKVFVKCSCLTEYFNISKYKLFMALVARELWSSWTKCSKSCGVGTQLPFINCTDQLVKTK